eukprot:SAG11_NODE_955_length_6395_cov_7.590534_3_plen_79_part_00
MRITGPGTYDLRLGTGTCRTLLKSNGIHVLYRVLASESSYILILTWCYDLPSVHVLGVAKYPDSAKFSDGRVFFRYLL